MLNVMFLSVGVLWNVTTEICLMVIGTIFGLVSYAVDYDCVVSRTVIQLSTRHFVTC